MLLSDLQQLCPILLNNWVKNYTGFNHVYVDKGNFSKDSLRGIGALKKFQKGDTVFIDPFPLVAFQFFYSQISFIACATCGRSLGSLKQTLQNFFDRIGPAIREKHLKLVHTINTLEEQEKYQNNKHPYSPVEVCGHYFCNSNCANKNAQHSLICSADEITQTRWKDFIHHAKRYYEGLILAGLSIARVIFRVSRKELETNIALAEFFVFHRKPWTEQKSGLDVPCGNNQLLQTVEGRASVLQEAIRLLKLVFSNFEEYFTDSEWKILFSLEFIDNIMGVFDCVCTTVEYENSLNNSLPDSISNFSKEIREILLGNTTSETCFDTNDSEKVLPDFIGLALFRVVALCNHSCDPNVEIEYDGYCARAVALHTIEKAEQVTISYIDESFNLDKRRELLNKFYHFYCRCRRCMTEERTL